jgi:hypothetical protein
MKKLLTGHKVYAITDYVNIWPLRVTLTLEVRTHVLRMTYHLIIETFCGKYFQNPLIYLKIIDGTQIIPYNKLC